MAAEGQPSTGTTPEHLRDCLRYLTDNGYAFVSLEEVIKAMTNQTPLPEKAVVFTMDDGFSDQGQIAAPIFLEFGCPLTFFVITGLLDKSLWPWDAQVAWIIDNSNKQSLQIILSDETFNVELGDANKKRLAREIVRNTLKEMDAELVPDLLQQLAETAGVSIPEIPPSSFQPLDWDKARELEARGVRFAPHSKTHRILSKLSRESAKDEILGSWETINRELNNPLKVFCYPTGRVLDFGPREINILKDGGFIGAAATIAGYVEPENSAAEQVFRLPRLELPDSMTDFIQYCSWIEHARKSN